MKCPKYGIFTKHHWVWWVAQSNFAGWHSSFFSGAIQIFFGQRRLNPLEKTWPVRLWTSGATFTEHHGVLNQRNTATVLCNVWQMSPTRKLFPGTNPPGETIPGGGSTIGHQQCGHQTQHTHLPQTCTNDWLWNCSHRLPWKKYRHYRLVRLTKACRGETASAVKAHRKSPHRIRGWAKADDVSRVDVTWREAIHETEFLDQKLIYLSELLAELNSKVLNPEIISASDLL